jgi:hypothetical protein
VARIDEQHEEYFCPCAQATGIPSNIYGSAADIPLMLE